MRGGISRDENTGQISVSLAGSTDLSVLHQRQVLCPNRSHPFSALSVELFPTPERPLVAVSVHMFVVPGPPRILRIHIAGALVFDVESSTFSVEPLAKGLSLTIELKAGQRKLRKL